MRNLNKKLLLIIILMFVYLFIVLAAPPYFTTNPYINSTLGTNLSNQDLFISFVPRLNESANLNYSIQIFTNNITNFTLYNISTTNNTFTMFRINFSNLTRTQTWKAQIQLSNASTLGDYFNTTELLILNAIPTRPILNLPSNNSYFNYRDINFSMNNSDDIDDEQTLYFILEISTDFAFSNTSIYNGTLLKTTNATNSYNITTNLSDGIYYWRARATDLVDNSSITEIRNFTIDITNPSITLNYPVDGLSFTTSTITFRYTVTDINIANSTLFIDNIPLKTNSSGLTSGVQDSYTNTTLKNGNHKWYVNVRDLANNQVNSSIFNFLVDVPSDTGIGSGAGAGGAGGFQPVPPIQPLGNQTQPSNETNVTQPTIQEISENVGQAITQVISSKPEDVKQFFIKQKIYLIILGGLLSFIGIDTMLRKKKIVWHISWITGIIILTFAFKPEYIYLVLNYSNDLLLKFSNSIGIGISTGLIIILVIGIVIFAMYKTIKRTLSPS